MLQQGLTLVQHFKDAAGIGELSMNASRKLARILVITALTCIVGALSPAFAQGHGGGGGHGSSSSGGGGHGGFSSGGAHGGFSAGTHAHFTSGSFHGGFAGPHFGGG